MQVNNPFIKQAESESRESSEAYVVASDKASMKSIGFKTLFLILAAIISGGIIAIYFNQAIYSTDLTEAQQAQILTRIITALSVAAVISFIGFLFGRLIPASAVVCGPLYAVGEGAMLGALCALCEMYVPGITATAGVGTAVIALLTYVLYASGLKNKMNKVYAFFFVYAISLLITVIVLNIFLAFNSVSSGSYFAINIAICILYLGYGVIMLMLNFDEASNACARGVDKKYEWSIALGLVYTILMIFYYLVYLILLVASKVKSDN